MFLLYWSALAIVYLFSLNNVRQVLQIVNCAMALVSLVKVGSVGVGVCEDWWQLVLTYRRSTAL